jgi:hypothetical protein
MTQSISETTLLITTTSPRMVSSINRIQDSITLSKARVAFHHSFRPIHNQVRYDIDLYPNNTSINTVKQQKYLAGEAEAATNLK